MMESAAVCDSITGAHCGCQRDILESVGGNHIFMRVSIEVV